MSVKSIFSYLLCAATALPLAGQQVRKVKPAVPSAPPAAQYISHQAVTTVVSPRTADAPYGLELLGVKDKSVSLRWTSPEATDGFFEDFEGHDDFVINSPGQHGWTYIDGDNEDTYTWTAASFPNQGQKMAFIVMNPSQTVPSTSDWPAIQPYSGQKFLAAFTVDGGNNDFLVSPELNFDADFQLSFRAKSYTDSYGLERIRVGYSTTGTRIADFTFVQEGDYEEVGTEWELKTYRIPREAKYVTINCVSHEAFILMLDDIFIGTNVVRPRIAATNPLQGFRLLRDGVSVNEELIREASVTDEVPDYGTYTYTVWGEYADGSRTAASEALVVEVPDIRLLPFFDDFDSNSLDADVWNTDADAAGNKNYWKADYYPYGLVDPSLTYCYSSLKNYSQSAVTRELRTPDRSNTRLRFNLRLDNGTKATGDTLLVEVGSDAGGWQCVDSFLNDGGSFNWRAHEYDLSALLTDDLFRLRFRAAGADASYVDYWYVDDVKVWNPVWAKGTISLQSGGSPLSGCTIRLTADHGADFTVTTDDLGTVRLDSIEAGVYTACIDQPGYNILQQTWTVVAGEENSLSLQLLRPQLTCSPLPVEATLAAEACDTVALTLRNTGDGPVDWHLSLNHTAGSGHTDKAWTVERSFDASGDLQTCVAFDGEHYYTSSWYYLGKFFKYAADGTFLEEFDVPGMYYKLYDLAFDGKYFYGSDYMNRLFQLDLRNKRLVGEISVESEPSLKITHVSYDPRYDQFWVGSFTSIGRIDRQGNVVVSFRSIDSSQDLGIYGSAYDDVTPGGPYLWLANEMIDGLNEIDKVQIAQYHIGTLRMTGVTHSLIDLPGYKVGSLSVGENNICGIETTTSLIDGQLTLIGTVQQSPAHIFAYRLCDATEWLSYSPKAGTLQPGEEQQVQVTFNSRNALKDEVHTADWTLFTYPDMESGHLTARMSVNADAERPRPRHLTAEVTGADTVCLAWDACAPGTGYVLFRNGTEIARTASATWCDAPLVRGHYTYTVQALYADGASQLSDAVEVDVKVGAPYFPPVGLEAAVAHNREVSLQWEIPAARGLRPATLNHGDEENVDGIGLSEGGYFWAASAWDADALEPYRNMRVDSVRVFMTELCQYLSLQIYQDGRRVTNQRVTQTLTYGAWNTIVLNTPITLERGSDYKFGVQVMHESGRKPLGVDGQKVKDGSTDVVSYDGKVWVPASYIGFDGGHFNIMVCLSPTDSVEAAPTGYHVWRDGERLTATPVSGFSYVDEMPAPGRYAYAVSSVYGDRESEPGDAVTVECIELTERHAPSLLRAEVEHNRTVSLRWDIPLGAPSSWPVDLAVTHPTCHAGWPELVASFRGAVSSEYGIASDGRDIYTTVFSGNGLVNRYTPAGTFCESFTVDSYMDGIRNLAYDGTDFYAATTGSVIYRLDMASRSVADTIMVSEIARHLAYVPELNDGKGGFEVGDWTTSIYTTRMGAKLGDGPTYRGAAGTAAYDGILYAFEQGYEHPYVLCLYDLATGRLLRTVDLKDYAEIAPATGASAGGLSVVHTPEGLHLLAAALQEPAGARFFFFDLGSVRGLSGYYIYRNGVRLNDEPVPFRYFSEEVSLPGVYTYEVETAFVDGSTSGRSPGATIEILEAGQCDVPSDVKARCQTNGYDVTVSYVDPTSLTAEVYVSAEDQPAGEAFAPATSGVASTGWTVSDADALQGRHALAADTYTEAVLTLSPGAAHTEPYRFAFAARNADDRRAEGSLRLYVRRGGEAGDFLPYATLTTTEAWQEFAYTLEADVTDVQIVHEYGRPAGYVDAVSIGAEGEAYAYDIRRDGVLLNEAPVAAISYVDHNLLPGKYTYSVRAYYNSSCISEWSEPVTVQVSYSSAGQAPGPLSVETTPEGNRLQWSAPALGDGITLKWHSGTPHAAAGMPSGGAYYAGVAWNAEQLTPYAALSLAEVEVYINQIPDALFLLAYEGSELVRAQYVPTLTQYSYNSIPLAEPLPIDATRNLRVVAYVEHNEISVPIGYDEGPARTGLGDLYSPDGTTWSTLTDNDIDGNWNISLRLKAYAAGSATAPAGLPCERFMPTLPTAAAAGAEAEALVRVPLRATETGEAVTLAGYNAYCNGQRLNDALIAGTSYVDADEHTGRYYEYCVKAAYTDGSEVASNVVRVTATGIDEAPAATGVRAERHGDELWVEGVAAAAPLCLFDSTGRKVRSARSTGARTCLSLRGLPVGTYLLAVPGDSLKVLVTAP